MIKPFLSQLKFPPENIDPFIQKCSQLYTFLCEENKISNLTRIISEDDYWIKHVVDSLLLLEFKQELAKSAISIADLGCGAGFPALILALALPECKITAIDSITKKTDFVSRAGEMLNLQNLHVLTGRGRELGAKEKFSEHFDLITARAVSEAKKVFREVRRMLKSKGRIILYKTPEAAEKEICELGKYSSGFEWEISQVYELPENLGSRCFLIGKAVPL